MIAKKDYEINEKYRKKKEIAEYKALSLSQWHERKDKENAIFRKE
jgi:hypothetical protein